MQKVLIIVGPTAAGKSILAIKIAKKYNGEVISADSRQVYKGLDIGTGKITKKEMRGIPHHLLDVADPKKVFNAADYKKLADESIKDILQNRKLPIIVGGTGFYIDAVTGRTNFPEVPPNKNLRKKLERKSVEELYNILKKKDPRRAKNIDSKNKVRLVRALEIIEHLGYVPELTLVVSAPYKFIFIGIKLDQKKLNENIDTRLKERIPDMLKEARRLHREGLTYKRMEQLGLEYRYLARFLQNKISREEFESQLFSEIKKYSKRQMAWFKRNKKITWFDSQNAKEIIENLTKTLN
ncbi:MAG: tRNA (adenosine(37)-N6)-dimethylallyltransferase MiaA [bacterium]|nr:tRNA (adenosine(37)-N6)-dimethylallyltransferase MiaA [bacterium]